MRAVSTVVDATVFLLLLGGAVATVVTGTGGVAEPPGSPAAEHAELLSTTTATVTYSLAPAVGRTDGTASTDETDGRSFDRRAHGTLASHLATAAVGTAALDRRPLSGRGADFRRTVADTVRSRLSRPRVRSAVTAVWEPYPDAPLGGTVRVGDRPPADADVHAATLDPGSGLPASRDRAGRAARRAGYAGVARVVAGAVVRGLFPPNATRLALRGDYPVDALAAHRYRRAAEAFGAPAPDVREERVGRINDDLAGALADRLERDLRSRYQTPEAAAAAVEVGSVRVTVRTWSP